jgi:multidrug efflux system outer membrane protein
MNIIDFGTIRGQVRAADARAQAALATYEQTVRTALADVETALVGTVSARNQLDEVSRDYAAAESLKTLTQKRYDAGLASRLDLLTAEQAYVLAGNRYTSAQAGVGTALANLYTALGGALPATETRE